MKSKTPILVAVLVLGGPLVQVALAVPKPKKVALDFQVIGTGDVGAADSCPGGPIPACTLTSTGTAFGKDVKRGGTYTLSLTTGDATATNSLLGVCLPAEGTGSVTGVKAAINFNTVGWLCEEGAPGSPLHYNGTYRISDRTGGGSVAATFDVAATTAPTFIKIDGVK